MWMLRAAMVQMVSVSEIETAESGQLNLLNLQTRVSISQAPESL